MTCLQRQIFETVVAVCTGGGRTDSSSHAVSGAAAACTAQHQSLRPCAFALVNPTCKPADRVSISGSSILQLRDCMQYIGHAAEVQNEQRIVVSMTPDNTALTNWTCRAVAVEYWTVMLCKTLIGRCETWLKYPSSKGVLYATSVARECHLQGASLRIHAWEECFARIDNLLRSLMPCHVDCNNVSMLMYLSGCCTLPGCAF